MGLTTESSQHGSWLHPSWEVRAREVYEQKRITVLCVISEGIPCHVCPICLVQIESMFSPHTRERHHTRFSGRLILCVTVTGPWGAQILGETFWVFLEGHLWMRLTFKLVD